MARMATGALSGTSGVALDVARIGLRVWGLGLARTLGFPESVELESATTSPGQVKTSLVVSETLCGKVPYLGCGATLALFDEISSLALMLGDRTFRAGVSVSMHAEILRRVPPGERVTIISTTTKIGAMLGYAHTELRSADGKLAAVGRHIKYLPMGWLWDIGTKPAIFPLTRYFHEYDLKRREAATTQLPRVPAGMSVAESFALEGIQTSRNGGGGADPFVATLCGDYTVRPEHLNYVGSMHGGAVCVLAEKAALLAAAAAGDGAESSPFVRFMETEYLLPGRRLVQVEAKHRPGGGEGGAGGGGAAEVVLSMGGRTSATATVLFGP